MRNTILNLSEENYATECIVGQANNSSLAQTQLRDRGATADNLMFTKPVALETAKFIGMKSDGLWYLASAEAGAGQVPALAINFQEAVNGMAIDPIGEPRTIELPVAPSGAGPGKLAYLSPANPGEVVAAAPTVSGQLIQVVGIFMTSTIVRTQFRIGDWTTHA